jgi:peroxiredoxin
MLHRVRISISIVLVLSFACAGTVVFAQTSSGSRSVADFQLKDTTGQLHTLQSYAGKIVVLVFWSYKCPVVLAQYERFIALQAKYAGKGIMVLGVDSNSNETAVEIARNISNLKTTFPVLIDSDAVLAGNLGATHTPSVFVIDRSGEVRYQGAFDNNRKEGSKDREPYVDNAVDELLAGRSVRVPKTKAFGCIIP